MKKSDLAKADFAKAADALTNEAYNGSVHLAICRGLSDLDEFIGNDAPFFFMYTFYAHLHCAQMCANRIFDTDPKAVTIHRFLRLARSKASKFRFASEQEVRACLAQADAETSRLRPAINILRTRRNNFLAHISPEFAFDREALRRNGKKLQLENIGEVLHSAGRIVNDLLHMWNRSRNQLRETHSDDYKKVIERVTKQLCAEIEAHEREFAPYDSTRRLPRPKACK